MQQQNNWHSWHIDIWRSKPHNFIKCVDEHGWTMVMYTLHPSRFKPTTWVVPFVISWGWFLCLLREIIIKTPFPTGPCLLFLSLKALYLCQDSLLLQKPCDLVSLQTGDQSSTNQKKIGYSTHGSPESLLENIVYRAWTSPSGGFFKRHGLCNIYWLLQTGIHHS